MTTFQPKGWDQLLEESRNRWNEPNEFIPLFASGLRQQFSGITRVLDAGYGAGRHIVYLHEQGFAVSGFDIAPNAEHHARAKLPQEVAAYVDLKTFDMHDTPWPYADSSFEGVVAVNVIHHTIYDGFVATLDEIARVLVPRGLVLATIASKGNHKYGIGEKIDEYTFLTDSGAEKGIPHAFFDETDLRNMLADKYTIRELREVSGEIPEADRHLKKEGALDHWLLYLEKK